MFGTMISPSRVCSVWFLHHYQSLQFHYSVLLQSPFFIIVHFLHIFFRFFCFIQFLYILVSISQQSCFRARSVWFAFNDHFAILLLYTMNPTKSFNLNHDIAMDEEIHRFRENLASVSELEFYILYRIKRSFYGEWSTVFLEPIFKTIC